jgi:hypothetical protein
LLPELDRGLVAFERASRKSLAREAERHEDAPHLALAVRAGKATLDQFAYPRQRPQIRGKAFRERAG